MVGLTAHVPFRWVGIFAGLLTLCFAAPLARWVQFALSSGLFSYVVLVPFISGYLAWLRRKELQGEEGGARWPSVIPAAVGLGFLVAGMFAVAEEVLTYLIISYCCLLWSGGIFFLGWRRMRVLAFPALFLIFMAPIPSRVVDMMEAGLQRGSAEVAYIFIKMSGIPISRWDMSFQLPGITLTVGPECSGIRSSLVLFLTSLVAGFLFLRKGWTRWVFALFVIPLGIVRNAFRILVLAYLTVRVDPAYIHSPIHHQGGPIFFVLSLIPFGIMLLLLRKIEK
ncbi:MAG: exosortase [Acidobacteria bacterium]|nr:exosortase [Acidobacteriota bacterium]